MIPNLFKATHVHLHKNIHIGQCVCMCVHKRVEWMENGSEQKDLWADVRGAVSSCTRDVHNP